jgi:hypothetical protein
VGELCKFWADTPDSIPTDLISNEKLDANLCLDIARCGPRKRGLSLLTMRQPFISGRSVFRHCAR